MNTHNRTDLDDSELAEAVCSACSSVFLDYAYLAISSQNRLALKSLSFLLLSSVYSCKNNSLGNTCYMNATVQTLRAVPELQQALTAYVLVTIVQLTDWNTCQICTPINNALACRAARLVSGYGKDHGQCYANAIPRHPTPSEITLILTCCTLPMVIFRRILSLLR